MACIVAGSKPAKLGQGLGTKKETGEGLEPFPTKTKRQNRE